MEIKIRIYLGYKCGIIISMHIVKYPIFHWDCYWLDKNNPYYVYWWKMIWYILIVDVFLFQTIKTNHLRHWFQLLFKKPLNFVIEKLNRINIVFDWHHITN